MELLVCASDEVFAYPGMKVYVLSHGTVPWRNVLTCLLSLSAGILRHRPYI